MGVLLFSIFSYKSDTLLEQAESHISIKTDSMHLYKSSDFSLKRPWHIEYIKKRKGRLDNGYILYERDTALYFTTDMNYCLDYEYNMEILYADTLDDVLLYYAKESEYYSLIAREKRQYDDASHHFFFGYIYPKFNNSPEIDDLLFIMKQHIVRSQIDSEKFIWKRRFEKGEEVEENLPDNLK